MIRLNGNSFVDFAEVYATNTPPCCGLSIGDGGIDFANACFLGVFSHDFFGVEYSIDFDIIVDFRHILRLYFER